ncbi:MAG: lytic transglycosylase domain-containing protein [Rickettsiales bacterium]|jgi:tetratricopeptide (TPR) repeat protein|nr:lytic transglycosylase domain-containing protein [Rickettsiales bacterium]
MILSEKDAQTYAEIFKFQGKGRYDKAKKLESEIEDRILMGDVLYQRYMAKDYYSSGAEVKDWMDKYYKHPGAEAIFKLSKKKGVPARYPSLPKIANAKTEPGAFNESWTAKKYYGWAGHSVGRCQSAIKKRNFKTAESILNDKKFIKNADETDWGRLAGRLAFAHYTRGNFDSAMEWGIKSAEKNSEFGLWTAGLLSFKNGDFKTSRKYFEKMLALDHINTNRKIEAAFWAGRAAWENGDNSAARKHWRFAMTARPAAFYGAMSATMLGGRPRYSFYEVAISGDEIDELMKTKYGKSALALIQIDQKELAESHLKYLITKDAPDGILHAVHALSASEELPRAALHVAPVIKERDILEIDNNVILTASFPLPQWEPRGGWNIDRALLFAIARQESRFKTNAKSRAGATGLLQLMPGTARLTANKRGVRISALDLTKAEDSMFLGQHHVKDLFALENVDNNIIKMLVSYNAGNGRLKGFEKNFETDDPLLYIESFPATETRQYVKSVMSNLWLYRARLDQPSDDLDDLARGIWPRYSAHDNDAAKDANKTDI